MDKPIKELKSEVIPAIRVSESNKILLEKAALKDNRNLSNFLIHHGLVAAIKKMDD